jgi:hypothetical protein
MGKRIIILVFAVLLIASIVSLANAISEVAYQLECVRTDIGAATVSIGHTNDILAGAADDLGWIDSDLLLISGNMEVMNDTLKKMESKMPNANYSLRPTYREGQPQQ